jgi:hypothetical protein
MFPHCILFNVYQQRRKSTHLTLDWNAIFNNIASNTMHLVSLVKMSANPINSCKLLQVSKDPKKKTIALSWVLQALAQV